MDLYCVQFVDFGGRVYATRVVGQANDSEAVDTAHCLNVLPFVGWGFEVWQDRRLVHRHCNPDWASTRASPHWLESPKGIPRPGKV
jgi:hypothetical protein